MVNAMDVIITSLETISAFNYTTGAFRWTMDELQNTTISQTEDKVDITGKQGRKLSSLKRNKTVTISGTNGIISAGLLETQTGSNFKVGNTIVRVPDHIVVTGDEATTTYKAVGTAGAEIVEIRVREKSGALTTKFVQDTAVGEGKFTYDPTTKKIAFNKGSVADGTEIAVFYDRQVEAASLENLSDNYSEKLTLYVDAMGEDKCGKVYHVQLNIPKADFDGNFELTLGDDQTVHAFNAEALAGGCGLSNALWTYTIVGVDAEDAE